MQEFLQNYRERVPLHLVFFLALVAVFYLLRRSLTPEAAGRLGAASAIFVLDRPFSSSLLLALIPSALFYPGAAAGILRTAIVPTVISVIRLLPPLAAKGLRALGLCVGDAVPSGFFTLSTPRRLAFDASASVDDCYRRVHRSRHTFAFTKS